MLWRAFLWAKSWPLRLPVFLTNETGFRLVCKRGELMQHEAEQFDTVYGGCGEADAGCRCRIFATNIRMYIPSTSTAPVRLPFPGLSAQMPDFFADVKAAGGRAIPLKVQGAFHSPFMNEAANAFAQRTWTSGRDQADEIPLYSNMTARALYARMLQDCLSKQICNPVQWENTHSQYDR